MNNQLKIGWFTGCDASQHYTMLFNAFVVMTLFNQVPSRKLKGEMWFFGGILSNPYFCTLLGMETLGQVLFTQFGGNIFGVYGGGTSYTGSTINSGLTGVQWIYCILFGVIGWIWQLALNLINVKTQQIPPSPSGTKRQRTERSCPMLQHERAAQTAGSAQETIFLFFFYRQNF